jgi:hypothetical protein
MRFRFLPLVLPLAAHTPAHAQRSPRPLLVGASLGADFSAPTSPTGPRVGASVVLPLIGPLDFYHSLELPSAEGSSTWQALTGLRLQPLGTQGLASIWYLGAGVALGESSRTALLTGVQWPPAGPRPFLEVRFLGGIEGGALHILAGLSIRLR